MSALLSDLTCTTLWSQDFLSAGLNMTISKKEVLVRASLDFELWTDASPCAMHTILDE